MSNKNSNWKWNAIIIAATVAAAAAPASAQGVMKAIVPFSFSISKGANLAPGNYVVIRDHDVWLVRNEDTRQAVLIATAVALQGEFAEKPSLTFDCAGGHCQLRAIHMGSGARGAQLPAPKWTKADAQELAVVNVPLEPHRGE